LRKGVIRLALMPQTHLQILLASLAFRLSSQRSAGTAKGNRVS
jgi:hypothetical protein